MRIQHNIMAMNAYRNYNNNTSALSQNLEKLSSGYKINRAGDDAAGLAISEKMRAQITGLDQAQDNAQSGINLVQTAEGALQEVHDMLNRMVKLADQSANGTYDNEVDRDNLQKEVNQLMDEIDRIADSANYNGIKLLNGDMAGASVDNTAITVTAGTAAGKMSFEIDLAGFETATKDYTAKITIAGQEFEVGVTSGMTAGAFATAVNNAIATSLSGGTAGDFTGAVNGTKITFTAANNGADGDFETLLGTTFSVEGGGLTLQIGDTSDDFNQLTVSIQDMHTDSLKLDTISIANQESAQAAVDIIKNAINTVSSVRGTLGATQNRLDHTINNLSVMQENIQDAESTIRDTDVADEMMAYTKNNILVQSAQAMLAQANQVPQGVLQLLQ